MRAQPLIELEVVALGQQVDVELAQHLRKTIRVLDLLLSRLVGNAETVGEPLAPPRDRPLEEAPRIGLVELRHDRIAGDHAHGSRTRLKGADDQGLGTAALQSQQCERIAVPPIDERCHRGRIGPPEGGPWRLGGLVNSSTLHRLAPAAGRRERGCECRPTESVTTPADWPLRNLPRRRASGPRTGAAADRSGQSWQATPGNPHRLPVAFKESRLREVSPGKG